MTTGRINQITIFRCRTHRHMPPPSRRTLARRHIPSTRNLADNQLNRTLKFAVTGKQKRELAPSPPPAAEHHTHTQCYPRTQQHSSPNLDYITNQFQIALFEFLRAQSAKHRRRDLARSNTFRISTLRGGCPRRSQSCDRLSPQAFPQVSNSLKQIARS